MKNESLQTMNRRQFLGATSVTAALLAEASLGRADAGAIPTDAFPVVRTPEPRRKFKSAAVERLIYRIRTSKIEPELAWMFENCFPNTLDTTVDFGTLDGRPDTYVITGDIDAMWLRDSTAQVWPYLPLMKEDPALAQLIAGVINRQTRCILKDPYANAFYKDESKISQWKDDRTEMKPGVHERKWEIDSLCFPIRLAYHYWKTAGDAAPLDAAWRQGDRQDAADVPRATAEDGPRSVPLPAANHHAYGQLAGFRLWPPGQAGRADLLDVSPQRRFHRVSLPRAVEFLRRGQPAPGRRDAGSDPSRSGDGRPMPGAGG